jgi:hypothetical protein
MNFVFEVNIFNAQTHRTSYSAIRYLTLATMLPVILYGCETPSPTFKEEGKCPVSEYKIMRKIFGTKKEK